ncbi:glycoside hydrolase family 15 protein [Candidatus Nanohalococcus occultus]|uniref:glycoside hydrolase family 15 protein n=1 Tax=Candidatus Nanohalococcus occultus TaxID=2978047 RepID=UPI0039E0DF7D
MVRHLALGNGSLLVNLDDSLRVRDFYYPYAGQEDHVLGEKCRIGIHADSFSWIEDWETEPRYKDRTIVTESKARNSTEDLEIVFNSCVDCDKNVFLREIEVKNSRETGRTVEIFFQQNFNVYGNSMEDTALFRPEENGLVHYEKNRYFMIDVKKEGGECGDFEQYGIYSGGLKEAIASGELNSNPIAQGEVESALSVKLDVPAGGSRKFYYWINTGKNFDEVRELNRGVDKRVQDFFEQTEMCWRGYIEDLDFDAGGLDNHIEQQLKRSILVVRSQINHNGAITAANDSTNLDYNRDKYGYVWPRDGALVAETMAQAGFDGLVEPFFDFLEDVIEEEGYFLHKYNPDKSLGSSWHPWVDENGDPRLPIQEDETALVIWSLKKFADYSGNQQILEEKWSSLVKPAADFIHEYFDQELGLPKPSHDLWEEKHYISSFTVASVYAGLVAAADIADRIDENGEKYRERAETIKHEGLEKLRSEKSMRYGRGLEGGELIDEVSAPLIFLEKFGLIEEDDQYFENTVNAIEHDLSPDTEIGGIARYKGDCYHSVTSDFEKVPGNPWVICTLWLAQHRIMNAESSEELESAKEHMHWAHDNALETGILPEQVDPFTGEGKSVAPLTWSHSTFIETAMSYLEKKKELG